MIDNHIPMAAYALVGLTSAVLAYVTITDTDMAVNTVAATSMLPGFNSEANESIPPTTEQNTAAIAEPVSSSDNEPNNAPPIFGGSKKQKKNKTHGKHKKPKKQKKTKRSKN